MVRNGFRPSTAGVLFRLVWVIDGLIWFRLDSFHLRPSSFQPLKMELGEGGTPGIPFMVPFSLCGEGEINGIRGPPAPLSP